MSPVIPLGDLCLCILFTSGLYTFLSLFISYLYRGSLKWSLTTTPLKVLKRTRDSGANGFACLWKVTGVMG